MVLDSPVDFTKMYTRYLAVIFALGLSGSIAHAEGCRLSNSYVRKVALNYVREKLQRTSPANANEKLRVDITLRSGSVWTVVVSPLPVTPDSSFMLRVSCGEPKIEEIDAP